MRSISIEPGIQYRSRVPPTLLEKEVRPRIYFRNYEDAGSHRQKAMNSFGGVRNTADVSH